MYLETQESRQQKSVFHHEEWSHQNQCFRRTDSSQDPTLALHGKARKLEALDSSLEEGHWEVLAGDGKTPVHVCDGSKWLWEDCEGPNSRVIIDHCYLIRQTVMNWKLWILISFE